MKKKIKKTEEKTFKAGDVMSLLESMNDGIQMISEQHGEIVTRLDNMQEDVDGIKSDIVVIKSDIDVIKNDIVDIKYDLKEKVSYEEFEKMEKRVVKLEKLVLAKAR